MKPRPLMPMEGDYMDMKPLPFTLALVERCYEVPHDCDVPNCPGPVNKRKLDAFWELLEVCEAVEILVRLAEFPSDEWIVAGSRLPSLGRQLRNAIAKAKGETP